MAEPRALDGGQGLRGLVQRLVQRALSLSLLTRAIAGSFLLAVLVAASFGVLLGSMSGLRTSADGQARSRDVTSATLGLEQAVDQLEVSLRSFLISGDGRFLTAWRQARDELPPSYASVDQLLAGQPAQLGQAVALASLIDGYISEYGQPLIAIYDVSPSAARAPVATSEGLVRVNAIRVLLGRLLTGEAALASSQATSASAQAARAVAIGIGALSAAALLLVAYGVFLVRGVAVPVRSVAAGASSVAAGDLSTRLPAQGAAEIRALTSAFNGMARSLEHGKRELEAQNEQLRQSERLKSQLVSIVSHELRTPLASILGYTTLLRRRAVEPEEARRYLDIIHQQGSRLASLIDRFLDGEHVEAGRIELDDEQFDLRPLIEAEARLVADKSPLHTVAVAIGAAELPVRGDHDRIAQVFANLMTNAVKYSPGGGRVEVSGAAADQIVRVEVRDEGIGVPEEHRSRIFTKFFRGEARESGIAGTGLGLAVSREIVEAHGGRIGMTAEHGQGSTFWFELPLAAELGVDLDRTIEALRRGEPRGEDEAPRVVGSAPAATEGTRTRRRRKAALDDGRV